MGRSVWCRVEVNDLLVRPDEAAPSSHAAVINASGIKKKLMVRLVKTFQPFSTPSLALPRCIFTPLLSRAGCQAQCFSSTCFLVLCSKQCVHADGLAGVHLSPVNLSIVWCLSARWLV